MPYILRTAYLIPDEALPRKGFQLLRTLQTVLDNKTRHLSATVFNFLYEVIRQQRLPIIKHGYSTFFGQTDISFQTIGFDTVQRAKQPIKKRSDT